MTALRSIGALLALGTLQIFLPLVWSGLGAVDWLLIYIVLQSLRVSFRHAILLGAGGGLVQDALSGGIIGLHAFAKTAVAAVIASFGGLLVVRGPIAEAIVTGAAALLESLLVVTWQVLLESPMSLGPFDIAVRTTATALATLGVLWTARWWEQRRLRRRRRRQ